MPRTRPQSTPVSDDSISGWDSDSELSDLSRSPSPAYDEQEHIPRPPNCFILYRAHAWKERLERGDAAETMTMAAFGKHLSPIWRSEPEEVRAFWQAKAKEAEREHKAKYPGYVYRPNRGGRSRRSRGEEERPKRAPCKSRTVERTRKEATPSAAQRTMKTRSMTQQRQAVVVRAGAEERRANAETRSQRKTTTPRRGNRQQTRGTTRRVVIDLTAGSDDEDDVNVQGRNQNAPVMRPQVSQEAVQSRRADGGVVFPPTFGLLPVGGGILSSIFDLPVGGEIAPADRYQALPAHFQSPDAFNESLAPSNSTSVGNMRIAL